MNTSVILIFSVKILISGVVFAYIYSNIKYFAKFIFQSSKIEEYKSLKNLIKLIFKTIKNGVVFYCSDKNSSINNLGYKILGFTFIYSYFNMQAIYLEIYKKTFIFKYEENKDIFLKIKTVSTLKESLKNQGIYSKEVFHGLVTNKGI